MAFSFNLKKFILCVRCVDGLIVLASFSIAIFFAQNNDFNSALIWVLGSIVSAAAFVWQPLKWISNRHFQTNS